MTGQIVLEVAGLQFHFMIYSRENEHEGRHSIKERLSKYKGR